MIATTPKPTPALRWRLITIACLLAATVMTFVLASGPETASAATVAVDQCNYDETGAAREIRCDVTVVNNLDVATGLTSSTVTTVICQGAPGAAGCGTPVVVSSTDIVGSVNQCNNSVNAGGSTIICNVVVTNNITGVGSTSPATVNQCVDSAAGGAPICNPTSSVTGADITQCNGSGNGLTLVRFECTVNTSTVSSLWPVDIVQCNDSNNGGGGTVECTARIQTVLIAPVVATTTTLSGVTTTTGASPTTAAPGGTTTTPNPSATTGTNPTGTTPGTGTATTTPIANTLPTTPFWLPETL